MRIRALAAVLVTTALTSLSGCGFFKAIVNPSAAWAISESTPMSVVVRRAEVSSGVADEVDRLMGETPIDTASQDSLTLEPTQAQAMLEGLAKEPVYGSQQQQVRVVPAEAWLKAFRRTCGEEKEAKTLIDLLGSDVATKYRSVTSTGAKIAALKGTIAELETKADAEGTSEADKKALQDQIAKHEEEIAKLDEAFGPAKDELLEKMKTAASQARDEDKKVMSPIVLNLLEAVDDARNANSAATMRYPMALPGLQDDLPAAVKRFAADVIEEQTGVRPDMNGLKPDVKLEGADVKLTLNGIPHDKIGDIDPGEIITETTTRTTDYVAFTLTLLAYMSETEERLSMQEEILEAWQAGLNASVEATAGAIDISGIEVASTPGQGGGESKGGKDETAKRSLGGVHLHACYGAPASYSAVASALKSSSDSKKTAAAAKPESAKSAPKASKPSDDKPAKPAAAKTAPAKTAAAGTSPKPNKRPAIRRTLDGGPRRTAKRSGGSKPAKRGPTRPASFQGGDAPRVIDAPATRALPGEDDVPVRDVN